MRLKVFQNSEIRVYSVVLLLFLMWFYNIQYYMIHMDGLELSNSQEKSQDIEMKNLRVEENLKDIE